MIDSRQKPKYHSHCAHRGILLKTRLWSGLTTSNRPSEKASVVGEIVTPSHPPDPNPGYHQESPSHKGNSDTYHKPLSYRRESTPTLRSNKEYSYIDRYNINTCQHFSIFPLVQSPFV